VTNLLTNALKFTPADGRVTIAAGPADGQAVLRVSDTGAGIPAEELPRIFDRFWRGRQASAVSGSGIGLAIAAELARAHEGRIEVASALGHGSRFTLILPLAPAA
jgi:signal transduction histidine kinase